MSLLSLFGVGQAMQSFPEWIDFFRATPVATGVNAVIVVLVVGALINLLSAKRRLDVEKSGVRQLESKSPEPDEVEGLLADKTFRDTLVGKRARVFRDTGAPPSLELVAASDAEDLHQTAAFARGTAASVVLLGLAGTLVGLSLGVAPLVDVLETSAPDVERFWTAMNDSVAGMRTAFSTTLLGVIGALIVGAGLTLQRRTRGRLLVDLERVTLTVLAPAYSPSGGQSLGQAVEKIDEVRESFEKSFSDLTERVDHQGRDLSERVSSGFDDATAEIIHGFRGLLGPFEEVRDATLALVGTPEEGTESLSEQVARLSQAASELERSVESVERLIPELRDTLIASFREQSEATRDTLESYYGQMAKRVEEQAESTRRLSEDVRESSEAVAGMVESLQDFSEAADEYREVWAEVAKSVQDAEKTLDRRLAGMGQTVEDSLGNLVEKQARSQERVLNSLAQFETQLTEAIEAVERERRRAVSRSEEFIRELRDAVQHAIHEIDARSEDQQETVSRAIRQGLQDLKLELRDILMPGSEFSAEIQAGPGTGPSAPELRPHDAEHGESNGGRETRSRSLDEVFGGGGTRDEEEDGKIVPDEDERER